MFYAKNSEGRRVFIDQTKEGELYYCPLCGSEVITKKGDINVHHFAHKINPDSSCDDWSSDMSDWHRNWQEQFPEECREVVIVHEGEKHRADILIDQTVIEFQHSRMSNEEFEKRNNFYVSAGYKLIWLFDMVEEFENEKMTYGKNQCTYKWNYHWHTFDGFVPKKEKNVVIYIQIVANPDDEGFGIERLIWQSPDGKHLMTEDGQSYSRKEFISILFPNEESEVESKSYEPGIEYVYDTLIDVDGMRYPCPQKVSREEAFENCDTCMYSICCMSENNIGYPFRKLYDRNHSKLCVNWSGCLYRFRDILDGWDVNNDKVIRISYDDEYRITGLICNKHGQIVSREYEQIPKRAVTLLSLLRSSDAKVVGAINIRTGTRVKVGNSDYFKRDKIMTIHGYIGFRQGRGYSGERTEIFYWNRPEWIKEWER